VGQDNILSITVQVSPNPFRNQLQIFFGEALEPTSSIRLLDVLGRTQQQWSGIQPVAGTLSLTIDNQLAAGPYYLQITRAGAVEVVKVVKI
jgi:hypothetical protein